MIPIVYFRSSSFNCDRFCPMQYYCEYGLGWKGKGNKKADKGTITHKILEICALCKKASQDGLSTIIDEDVGEILTDNYDPEYLGSVASRVYQVYTKRFNHHKWSDIDFRDCLSWAWKALKYRNGLFDPRYKDVVAAEPHFDFEIDKEWADYDYQEYGLKGKLALKGTIDLITDLGDNCYEIVDYKTGQRKDWATGKTKDQQKLFTDAQLRLYHYAVKHMYPHVHTFLITIYFINDGGPFTVHFQDADIPKTEEMIKERFNKIKNTKQPSIIRQMDPSQAWKCKKLCDAGMTSFENTHVEPLIEKRFGQFNKKGQPMSKCEQIRYMIKEKGIEWVTKNYMNPNHKIGSYGHGGGKIQD